MKCPVCLEVNLVMTERQGIEVDYCPQCRGVWLDRGELDKIIDRSAASVAPTAAPWQQSELRPRAPERAPEAPPYPERGEYDGRGYDRRDYDDDDDRYDPRRRKKRGGFLGELFDFD